MTEAGTENLRERLRRALPAAMRARDRLAVNALRSALAAIDNAGAVDPAQAPPTAPTAAHPDPTAARGGHPGFAGSVAGLGAAEVARRSLSQEQMEEIVRAEVLERERAAAGYERAGQPDLAERLRGEAMVLTAYLDTS